MIKEKLNYVIGVAALILLGVTFWFFSDVRRTQRVQAGFLGTISPFLKQGSSLQKYYTAKKEGLKRLDELEKEVTLLRTQNKELMATNQALRGVEAERNALKRALAYREEAAFQLMPARIIARDPSTWFQRVTIDRGSEELIEPDQAVLTESGLVGKTTNVISAHSAQVILISDENCRVSARIEGTDDKGIVQGERNKPGTIGLGFLSKQAKLQKGRSVFTSGIGRVYPEGILIGAIEDFHVRELDAYATLKPAVDLTTLEDVFVVIGEKK
jgi:rod shape-determining protein MreC